MPNNDNFNFENELPKMNNDNMNNQPTMNPNNSFDNLSNTEPAPTNQQIIEIPQEYYDQLAKEKAEEEQKEQERIASLEAAKQPSENAISGSMIPFAIITAIVTYAVIYLTVNVKSIILIALPIYVVGGALVTAITNKKKNDFGLSVLIGGMICAVICFVISMLNENDMDLWTYYTVVAAITGFLGTFIVNLITKIITDAKNIKALQTIGYILFFAALIGGPIFAYKKYPTEFHRIVFFERDVVIVETYEDFVVKTLKNRYNINFTCDFSRKHNYINEKHEKMATVPCTDTNGNQILATTTAFNESAQQYILKDEYLENLYLKELKEGLQTKIKTTLRATEVIVYLYPEKNCYFLGDCVDCEEYTKIYNEETNTKLRYEQSKGLNLSKYVGLSLEEFKSSYLNNQKYKVMITIRGNYNDLSHDFAADTKRVLASINNLKFKNTYGYEITFDDYKKNEYEKIIFKVKGKASDDGTFKDPVVINQKK